MNLSHSVTLVTGDSSGIGLATTKLPAAAGAHVWLVARGWARLHDALAEVNAVRQSTMQHCGALSADISDLNQATAAVHRVATLAGPPDVVIDSAGVVFPGHVEELDPAAFRRQIEVNTGHKVLVKSPEFVARAILDGMVHRRYIITPGLDTTFLYWLCGVAGPLRYRIMDEHVAHALCKTGHGRITHAQERANA